MKMYDARQVAEILQVEYARALTIIRELPHCDVGIAPDSQNKHIRISEAVLEGYMSGKILRKPWQTMENMVATNAKTDAIRGKQRASVAAPEERPERIVAFRQRTPQAAGQK